MTERGALLPASANAGCDAAIRKPLAENHVASRSREILVDYLTRAKRRGKKVRGSRVDGLFTNASRYVLKFKAISQMTREWGIVFFRIPRS